MIEFEDRSHLQDSSIKNISEKSEIFDGNIFLARLAGIEEHLKCWGDWEEDDNLKTSVKLYDEMESMSDTVQEALEQKFITEETALELFKRLHKIQEQLNQWINKATNEINPQVTA